MIKKVKGGIKQRIAALIIGVAVLVYTEYHVASLFGEDIATVITGISTEATVLDGKGYIFRDETALYSDYTGVTDYLKEDGTKVSIGEELAEVRVGGDSSSRSLVKYLDNRIEVLEESVNEEITLADLPEINDEIGDAYYALAKMLASGDTGGIAEQTDKLLLNMNRHSIATDGENSPVEHTLESMKQRRESILTNNGGSVVEYAADSGYFYSYVDGYEDRFTVEAADNLTVSQYYSILDDSVAADAAIKTYSYGKLAESAEWRFVMRVAEAQKGYFKVGNEYNFEFVENGNTSIPMTLVSELEDDQHGGKILVFRANRLPDGFVFDRCQSVSVTVNSMSGIYVPRSAVHRAGGGYCVYVLKGSVVKLRRIYVIYEGRDYYLCDPNVASDSGVDYLGTNELLIIKGSDLFDGRILD